ncbi:hypothetical protein L218DRAFT_955298 [Marasmius fiardii PR-910]|nr:hypothetical protein L218DRAFT_955298 [Marasmius fiardii PR-910]
MEEELIVVDEEMPPPSEPQAGSSQQTEYSQTAPSGSRTSSRLRSTSTQLPKAPSENMDRATRFANFNKAKVQPKLKLKLSEKAASQAPGMSFLGQYDRELDSDDEDLVFEEQFVLRMPPGEDCDKLRKTVATREVSNDIWFKFKDSRRAVFHIGNNTYSAKLVDLPCIMESQKTLDNKQMFKVADICQMLVVENHVENDDAVSHPRGFNIEEFIWPHGITPPLHHVRKRRFRKRINKRTIESVEQEVERLLEADNMATEIKYEVLDNVNPDMSDSEFIEREEPIDAPTPAISDTGDAATPGDMNGHDEEAEGGDEEPEGDIDEELAAELDLALNDDEEEGDDEEEEEDESDEEDDDDDDDEDAQSRRLLNEEIRDLEAAVAKKNTEISSSANPLIRKRFEDALKKLTADLEMKLAQRDELKEEQRRKKEGLPLDQDPDSDSDSAGNAQNARAIEDDDLFGDENPMDMD